MSRQKQKIGAWGERIAAEYLKDNGYKVTAHNIRTPYGEIDIIVEKDGLTAFVEVKTRTSGKYGPPEVAITPRKQEHMLTAAHYYAQENQIDHWQIDVIAVEGKPGQRSKITHFERAL